MGAVLLAGMAAIALLLWTAPASANNDPHRIYLAAAPFDLPSSFCGFPVHVEFPVNKEYAKVTEGADGSTILTVTGSLFVTLTNTDTGAATTVNASGPGTITISPEGTTQTLDVRGLFLGFARTRRSWLPSNIVLASGPGQFTIDLTTGEITSVSDHPHVLVDVCAALSP